ncbi:ly-6/neurotoxin-like protein 1 isoform X2 [Sceloporus undulatus]|uniref:ly-6/neurotoxin-like protein 1 isoform X2 n=1 Tax=Sceloporus undulatus TaxID=8520 RepID=UPI001C4AC87C|nr:ly-6/neurotoxin-like protein 1 isoform X2 [Sceloporus undulatus]
MNKILLLGFSALFCWSVAQGIVCKFCRYGNGKGCFSSVDVCKTEFGICNTVASYLGDELYYMSYGCLDHEFASWYCNTTDKDGKYTHIETCCETDKCNGKIPPLPRVRN